MILVSVRQPTIVHNGQFAVNLTPVVDRHCPFLRSFKRGKIKRLQQRRIAGKHAALAVQPTVRGVQAFNGIGGSGRGRSHTHRLRVWGVRSRGAVLTLLTAGNPSDDQQQPVMEKVCSMKNHSRDLEYLAFHKTKATTNHEV